MGNFDITEFVKKAQEEGRQFQTRVLSNRGATVKISTTEAAELIIEKLKDSVMALSPQEPVKLPKPDGEADEEEFILVLSDWQIGHLTRSFNVKVVRERIAYLLDAVLRIVRLHRKSHPVRTINLFCLGDFIQNERIGFMVDLDELEIIAQEQMFDVAIPELERVITTLLQHFEKVRIWCVRGNHGSLGKFAATRTNFDDVIYRFIQGRFREEPRCEVHLTEDFYQFVDIMDHRFLITHGDQIRMHMKFPWYSLADMALKWYQSLGPYEYIVVGHFHTAMDWDLNLLEVVCNGSLITDDTWVLKRMAWNPPARQILMSIHEKHGKVWLRKIRLP